MVFIETDVVKNYRRSIDEIKKAAGRFHPAAFPYGPAAANLFCGALQYAPLFVRKFNFVQDKKFNRLYWPCL
jgi:hypothetical protein